MGAATADSARCGALLAAASQTFSLPSHPHRVWRVTCCGGRGAGGRVSDELGVGLSNGAGRLRAPSQQRAPAGRGIAHTSRAMDHPTRSMAPKRGAASPHRGVEGAHDDLLLLLAGQLGKVHGVARHADGQVGVLRGVAGGRGMRRVAGLRWRPTSQNGKRAAAVGAHKNRPAPPAHLPAQPAQPPARSARRSSPAPSLRPPTPTRTPHLLGVLHRVLQHLA
jgi:hypothetical protein